MFPTLSGLILLIDIAPNEALLIFQTLVGRMNGGKARVLNQNTDQAEKTNHTLLKSPNSRRIDEVIKADPNTLRRKIITQIVIIQVARWDVGSLIRLMIQKRTGVVEVKAKSTITHQMILEIRREDVSVSCHQNLSLKRSLEHSISK